MPRSASERLTVLNRTAERVEVLKIDVSDDRVQTDSLSSVSEHLTGVRLLVSALEVSSPVLSREDFVGMTGDILIVDLGVPRAVSSDVSDLAHVRRIDIGDLRERVERALGDRREAIDDAQRIVADDVERFLSEQRARGAAVIVRELREHFDELITSELARRSHDLEGLTPEQRDTVISLMRSVVAKIAHRRRSPSKKPPVPIRAPDSARRHATSLIYDASRGDSPVAAGPRPGGAGATSTLGSRRRE